MKRIISGMIVLTCICLFGCSSFMKGYTQDKARDKYLLVDEKNVSFGYKRIKYLQGYYKYVKSFVQRHGLPDFIYELKNKDDHDEIRMFYVEENTAYIFQQEKWNPETMQLLQKRDLTDYEKATFKELIKNR